MRMILASGTTLDLAGPDPDALGIIDMAEHLSRQLWRNGLTAKPLCLAQVAAMLFDLTARAARHRYPERPTPGNQRRPLAREQAEIAALMWLDAHIITGHPVIAERSALGTAYSDRLALGRRVRYGMPRTGDSGSIDVLVREQFHCLADTLDAQFCGGNGPFASRPLPIAICAVAPADAVKLYLVAFRGLTSHHRTPSPGWDADRDAARGYLLHGMPSTDAWGHRNQPPAAEYVTVLEQLEHRLHATVTPAVAS